MELKPITNYYDYKEAQEYIESIKGKEMSSEEANKICILSILIEDFERRVKKPDEEVINEILIDYIFELVKQASSYEGHGIVERCLKLGEEYGELSAEILKLRGYKKSSETVDKINKNILLESTDCLIMILDIMIYMGFTKGQICEMAENQINKWMRVNNNVEV